MKEPHNDELYTLCKNFKPLGFDQKKGVLKTALGLLRIQRAQKAMIGHERPASRPHARDLRDT